MPQYPPHLAGHMPQLPHQGVVSKMQVFQVVWLQQLFTHSHQQWGPSTFPASVLIKYVRAINSCKESQNSEKSLKGSLSGIKKKKKQNPEIIHTAL